MEKTGCKIICGAPTTLAVKGLMMMMVILSYLVSWYIDISAVNKQADTQHFSLGSTDRHVRDLSLDHIV